MKVIALATAILLIGFFMGLYLAAASLYSSPAIYCPQEDSCYADYYDHKWHIIEGERPW